MRAALLWAALALPAVQAQVTWERLLNAHREPENWLTYSGTNLGQRYSTLNQITPENVTSLQLKWVFRAASSEKFQASPLAAGGTLYTVQPPNDIVAIDAATGRVLWIYKHLPANTARLCCGRVNRGLAILGDTLYMGTIDARLIAVNARSGKPVWTVPVARPEAGYSITHAPLVVNDKVIIGVAGGEYGIRGFLAAYDAKTGKEAWRFYTVPGKGEPGNETWAGDSWKTGGGSIWVTGSYDAELNITYWGVGNPGPDWNGDTRAGDNLYSESVVALDAGTGKLKWHYQFTPHDEFDFDAAQVPVLANIQIQGRTRKAMLWANRNGLYYVLDRTTGEFLLAKPFAKVTWMTGFDGNGRPQRAPGAASSSEGTLIYPSHRGATNWYSPSYSPRTGLFYVSTWQDTFSFFVKRPGAYKEGERYAGGYTDGPFAPSRRERSSTRRREQGHGAVVALDAATGERKWQLDFVDVTDSGVLTTATDLLFTGNREEHFFALDARSGKELWRTSLGGATANGPMTYAVGGHQYVAVAAGNVLFVFGLR